MALIKPGAFITLDGKYDFVVLETLEKDGVGYALLFAVDANKEMRGFPQVAEIIRDSEHEAIRFVGDSELAKELHARFMPMLKKRHDEMTSDE